MRKQEDSKNNGRLLTFDCAADSIQVINVPPAVEKSVECAHVHAVVLCKVNFCRSVC